MKAALLVSLCGICIAGCSTASSDYSSNNSTPSSNSNPPYTATNTPQADNVYVANTPTTNPDNTAINARDNSSGATTAGMQGQGRDDIRLTADIRRRVLDQKMSVNAQNVKIITINGKVTLRGPVNTQDEKDTVARIANDVAGPDNVINQLEVLPNG